MVYPEGCGSGVPVLQNKAGQTYDPAAPVEFDVSVEEVANDHDDTLS